MKATELRIGNWVNHNGLNQIVYSVMESFGEADCCLSYSGNGSRKIKPIPLTEELLLKFGFYRGFGNELRIEINNFVTMSVWFFELGIQVDIGDELIINKIEYVHQLQNLYFALTGEELEYNGDNN